MQTTDTFSYDYLNKKSDKIEKAANLYLMVGAFESFCKCLMKLSKRFHNKLDID